MKKWIIGILLFALLLTGCGTKNAQPSGNPDSAENAVFQGKGTAADPYQIATAEDLWKMAELVNTEDEVYRDAHYILAADVDLGGKAWTPIGDGYLDSYKSFPGTFDGNGHTISGLNITTSETDETRFFGLFGQVEGTVKNLTITSSTIDCSGKDSANTGAIVGRLDYKGIIENCHVSADVIVTGSYTTGGLVGEMAGAMVNCTNAAAVTGTSEVGQTGGLAGMVSSYAEYETSGMVNGCTNSGAVQSAGEAGGVAGALLAGTISDSTNEASVSGENAGGIVASVNAAQTDGTVSNYIITNCANSGTVSGTKQAGGIAADVTITTGNVTVSNCSNTAAVLGNNMGGILGSARTSTAYATLTVTGCSNSGVLEDADADGTAIAGGVVAAITGKGGGSFTISENKNAGSINAGTGRAGGILGSYTSAMSGEDAAVTLSVENCSNEATVSGGAMGIGGIVGEVSAVNSPAVTLTVSGCVNAGVLHGNTANVRIGGIVGVIEPHYCTAVFTNCTNSGNISCEDVIISESEEWFDFSAAMGGILGYAGVNGVSLTPEDDCGLGNTTVLTFDGCKNTGTITTGNEKVEYYTGDVCGLCVVGKDIH